MTVRPLLGADQPPTLVEPKTEGLSLVEWAHAHRADVDALYQEHRALLFRGFVAGDAKAFAGVVAALSDGAPLPYRDRSTPREQYGDNIYCTTVYPADQTIRPHNEGSYWKVWAKKAFFGCVTAPPVGGETPLTDVHKVHDRIDPAVRAEFAAKRWMLVRHYHEGFALPWQEVFQTQDRADVEAYCRDNAIEYSWQGDHLTTRQIRDAIRPHPETRVPLWFNHAAFFHISARPAPVRDALLGEFGLDGLPYHTRFGDGSEIPDDTVAHILAAYDAETVMFRWQPGDVTLIDNMLFAHARQPYEGDRLILVALTEPTSGEPEADRVTGS